MDESTESKSPLILVADDDPTVRMLARAALEKSGCTVEEAEDGAEALSLIANIKPDLILLDVMMPREDGYSVCAQVRRLPGLERTPICMMTGLNDTASIQRGYYTGATDFVTKPINWLILGQRVKYILRASKAMAGVRQSESKSREILGALPDTLLRISKEGVVLECLGVGNAGLPPIVNGSRATLFEMLPVQIARQLMVQVERALESGNTQVLECEVMLEGGLNEWEIRTVRCGSDEALSIIRNITERNRDRKSAPRE